MKYTTQTIPVSGYDDLFEFYILDTDKHTCERICGSKEFVELYKNKKKQVRIPNNEI